MPDLRVLPTVGRDAHRCRPRVRCAAGDCQILVLGPVPYPDVHCGLRWGETWALRENLLNLEVSPSTEEKLGREGTLMEFISVSLGPLSKYL